MAELIMSIKFHHVILSILLMIACLVVSMRYKDDSSIMIPFLVATVAFVIVTGVLIWILLVQAYGERIEQMTDLASKLSRLDNDRLEVLFDKFPTKHYMMRRGEVREYWEDTGVPVETFRLFLEGCEASTLRVPPERDWNTSDRPRWAHVEIVRKLIEDKYIISDSARGPNTWQFVNRGRLEKLMRYWMAGRKLIHLEEETA